MSSSVPCNIQPVLELVAKNILSKVDVSQIDFKKVFEGNPISLPKFKILDVGCGFGKWGFLIRDTFEVMLGQNFNKKNWKIKITGIEPFDKCITCVQEEVYDEIIKKDVFEVISELGDYDLIILGDVIEHFEKEKAYELLTALFKHSKNIIISTPLGFMPQGAWAGNEREIHRSGWELKDFEKYKVIEHKIIPDTLFKDIIKKVPGLPEEMKKGIQIIVLWLQK